MPLLAGEAFGSYEIIMAIGHGGMGEVFSARDLKLQRRVAVKVLPDTLAADPERLARFQREAEVLASLNHPNISGIYGVEESAGRKALILELVDGVTLSDRIARGPIPVDEALTIARQIAEALESAHERGVIHRDLKPSNIKVREDGAVKVLDFGLAKLLQPSEIRQRASDMSQSPTITSPALATNAGVILGTAAYMSPEQAKGKPVDRRSDMWAFGCVLYEMLTGRRAFEGEDVSDTLAEVLKTEPKWSALPDATPESIQRLLRRCLAKERSARLSDAAVARLEIDDAKGGTGTQTAASDTTRARAHQLVQWIAVMLATAGIAALLWQQRSINSVENPPPTRFIVQLPADVDITGGMTLPLTVSRDGRRIAFVARTAGGASQIWIRSLDRLEPVALRGTDGATSPFFSYDGQWIGFYDPSGSVKKIRVDGGTGVAVTVTQTRELFRGASWGATGTIVFSSVSSGGALMQVADSGGAARPLTSPSAVTHSRPSFLPDGQSLVYMSQSPNEPPHIVLLVAQTGETRVLLEGEDPRVTSDGFLVFRRGQALWAAPFDLAERTLSGEPAPILDAIPGGIYAVADNGLLVYTPPREVQDQRSLVWVSRAGVERTISAPHRAFIYPRISPDGTQIALDIRDQQNDIWVWHAPRQSLTRLTFNAGLDRFPVWSRDGKRIAFTSEGIGIAWQPADGSGTVEALSPAPKPHENYQGANNMFPSSFSPDGSKLLFWANTSTDIHLLSLGPPPSSEPILRTPFSERNAELSPDGRWIAYDSDESGRSEIQVRPFPEVNTGKWQVSTSGGHQPLWERSGRELFFRSPNGAVMRVPVALSPTFSPGVPTKLFEGPYFLTATAIVGRTYDVSPDGQSFLMIKDEGRRSSGREYLIAVQNAFAEFQYPHK